MDVRRGHPDADTVAGSQRRRIIDGIVAAASTKGYQATTLTDIVSAARVSRSTFYEHFADKEECFLAAIDTAFGYFMHRFRAEQQASGRHSARALMEVGIATYCESMAAEPDFARVLLIETPTAGESALARREQALAAFAGLFRAVHDEVSRHEPATPMVGDETIDMIINGIAERTRRLVAQGDFQGLRDCTPTFIEFAYRVLGLSRTGTA